MLAEFGDGHTRYATAESRKNYAATSPITRASGKSKLVLARFVHQDRLVDALLTQAFCALKASLGARAYYDQQRAGGSTTMPRCSMSPTGPSASSTAGRGPHLVPTSVCSPAARTYE
ncbi:hypothetical protein [Nocardia coffeae]|uniref:hypothetical protein n=1 Tax=Nocardia coffeae TaxID=2873381 RepID=UPI003FD7B6AF